jgi:hypothetical protein
MERSRAAWYVGLPLLVAAWLSAHGLAYALAPPGSGSRAEGLDGTGHPYLEHAPVFGALLLTLAAAGLVVRIAAGSAAGRPPPTWLFVALPLFGFTVQEHLERIVHGSAAPWATAAEPVFLLGAALQLPFGMTAVLVTRTALAAVERPVSRAGPPPARYAPALFLLPCLSDLVPSPAPLCRHAGRGPPRSR